VVLLVFVVGVVACLGTGLGCLFGLDIFADEVAEPIILISLQPFLVMRLMRLMRL
jgi:hypothetical protein